ncbi:MULTISPECIES: DUF58 domain-containing protein [Shewanella]|jgi:uncharacterized protein (DUF58 family)|uniref:Uncharacterized protein DUF58 n=1 Tax=Shewanella fodinae TaxID=552357 RepID=A0A4R2FCF6_9GAMM|nr:MULTISPECIES: DUF58 domain-containing protein [Shewanella]MBO1271750.1 DUF58 domain-containing protein [Shewanella sp. 4t3-1-2LB]MDN5369618.1 hypothetical protein [Shewanella sp.]TCN82816.1 uncharacterized protein DUF58 [Shewanella fodinae]
MFSKHGDTLFDPAFIEQVQQFSLKVSQAGKGGRLAEQKTPARGQGLEFADFKPYVAGDDLRAIDWNIYRRLGRVFVRVFEERQDLPLYILLDLSSSMFLEKPSRITAAKQAALALGAIALNQHDAVTLLPFSEKIQLSHKGLSGKHQLLSLVQLLEHGEQQDKTSLADVVQELSHFPLRQGLVVIISDFFDNHGIDSVVSAISLLKHRVLLVQLTQPWDATPQSLPGLTDDVRIQDCETGEFVDVQVTPEVLSNYMQAYQKFTDALTELAKMRSTGLLQLNASEPVLPQLATLFGQGGLRL